MAINIKNGEAEGFLHEIRARTGQGITEIVVELACERALGLRREQELAQRRALIEAACDVYASRLGPNPPHPDDIIGYDEHGLPR